MMLHVTFGYLIFWWALVISIYGDLIWDLAERFKSIWPTICDLAPRYDLWFAHDRCAYIYSFIYHSSYHWCYWCLTASICQDVTASRGTVARDISSRALVCDDAKLHCISADQLSDFTPSTLHPQARPGCHSANLGVGLQCRPCSTYQNWVWGLCPGNFFLNVTLKSVNFSAFRPNENKNKNKKLKKSVFAISP